MMEITELIGELVAEVTRYIPPRMLGFLIVVVVVGLWYALRKEKA